jgi:anaerobic selenocysteine-containing dehydrogenase
MYNPRMLWAGSGDTLVMGGNVNAQVGAMLNPNIEFSFYTGYRINATARYTDLVFPVTDPMAEESGIAAGQYGGIAIQSTLSGLTAVAGEAKSSSQFQLLLLAKRGGLDMARQLWTNYNGDATYRADVDATMHDRWASSGAAWLKAHGVANPPAWEDIKAGQVGHGVTQWHFPSLFPDIDGGTWAGQAVFGTKIDTASGKAEIFDGQLGDPTTRGKEHFDFRNRKRANLPNDPKDLQPISVYRPCYNGMEDFPSGRLKKYPLMILTGKTRYVIHSYMGDPGNPRMYQTNRHSFIMSASDAKVRGIKDNDLVRVFNDLGQVVVPAHVTNRIMPGVTQLRCGYDAQYTKSSGGASGDGSPVLCNDGIPPNNTNWPASATPGAVDMKGSANILVGGDNVSPTIPSKVTSTVQVEKYVDGKVY